VLDARLRSDRLALLAAVALALCGAVAAVAAPPLLPILLLPAVVLAAAVRPAGLLLAPLAAALPMSLELRVAVLAAAGAAAVAAALAERRRRGLEQRALVDPLTGLYRAEFFSESLEVELRRVHRYGGDVALVIFDLDDFKLVNDRHGHAVGNDVLRQVGEVLRGAARDSDLAARFGGEELVLLVRGDEQSATAAAARVVAGLRSLRFGEGLRVSCSAGVAALDEGGDAASLFASADQALYEAKRRGKDRVVVARRAPAVVRRRRAGGAA
jgi:diguanylate cyclase (GGDEF)-like protein